MNALPLHPHLIDLCGKVEILIRDRANEPLGCLVRDMGMPSGSIPKVVAIGIALSVEYLINNDPGISAERLASGLGVPLEFVSMALAVGYEMRDLMLAPQIQPDSIFH